MGKRGPKPKSVWDRFWNKVLITGCCWYWTSAQNGTGYGVINISGKNQLAHRVVLELLGIELIDGLAVDHICRTRNCVNPDHLRQVTNSENILAGAHSKLRPALTHCRKGHELNDDNSYIATSGSVVCRQCENAWRRANYAKRKNGAVRQYHRTTD